MTAVAAYCRVSTDKQDQANSFEAQQRYFREYISHQPDWQLFDVYADEGITGTSTEKRSEFNRMLRDAFQGKFQLIITKEVSRFSRNILDAIGYTRQLKASGVGVLFLGDGIHTLEPDAELRLSIMSTLAQEESRRTSARVKWGQTRQMERGIVFGRSLLGYDVRNGRMTVEPEGAAVVQRIFRMYGEEFSAGQIARILRSEGVLTSRGSREWSASRVLKILKNEKYAGDLIQKKTYTPDYLTHKKKKNCGEEALIALRDHHEPIIERDLWETVQRKIKERDRRNGESSGHSNRYLFSGKIRCGECGAAFVGRQKVRKDGSKIRRWSCAAAAKEGRRKEESGLVSGCSVGKLVRDDDAFVMLQTALKALRIDRERLAEDVAGIAMKAIRNGADDRREMLKHLQSAIERTEEKKEAALDSYFAKEITQEEMCRMKKRYERELSELQKQLDSVKQKSYTYIELKETETNIERYFLEILRGDVISEAVYRLILERLTVFRDRHMELSLNHLPQRFIFSE